MGLRLRNLHLFARLGLTGLVLTLALGLFASMVHLVNHYEGRDGVPGLTLDDIRASYHGLNRPAALVVSLEDGHPEDLDESDRAALLAWLASDRVSDNFDSLDLGDDAPAEIIARSCLECHSRTANPPASQSAAKRIPLDYWDDVRKYAFARSVPATPREIVLVSMHAHAPAMGTMSIAVALLAFASIFPRWLTGGLVGVMGVALIADLSSWLLARNNEGFVYVIVGAGAAYTVSTTLLLALVLLEFWRPKRGSGSEDRAGRGKHAEHDR